MPGMAAGPQIFERIQLPSDEFEIHLLEWIPPLPKESLVSYARRMSDFVKYDDAVLVGVSFGGMLVQEMKPFVKPRKIILISSAKSNKEFPRRMRFAKATKAYKFIPTHLFVNIEFFAKYIFKIFAIKQRIALYKKYLTVRDKEYLDWAIEQIVNWDRAEPDKEVVHIQGDLDEVFPIQYIENCITIRGGTHIMILNKYKWLNENLPKIILE